MDEIVNTKSAILLGCAGKQVDSPGNDWEGAFIAPFPVNIENSGKIEIPSPLKGLGPYPWPANVSVSWLRGDLT